MKVLQGETLSCFGLDEQVCQISRRRPDGRRDRADQCLPRQRPRDAGRRSRRPDPTLAAQPAALGGGRVLRPSGRTEGGFRLYTESDVEKILVIRRMKPLGFTLDQMSETMRDIEVLRDPAAGKPSQIEADRRLALVLADARGRRERLEAQLSMADEFIGQLQRELT